MAADEVKNTDNTAMYTEVRGRHQRALQELSEGSALLHQIFCRLSQRPCQAQRMHAQSPAIRRAAWGGNEGRRCSDAARCPETSRVTVSPPAPTDYGEDSGPPRAPVHVQQGVFRGD